ncbi:MAG: helix-turn-helix domain-containing protein [Pseudomonadota bacterium]
MNTHTNDKDKGADSSDEVFRTRLRQIRELRKMTQAELAQKTGMPVTSISHLEGNSRSSRKPSFDNLKRLATALEVSTDFLLGRVESHDSQTPDTLYRDIQNLSETDREIIRAFAETISKNKKK